MVSPRRLGSSTTRTVPSMDCPSSSEVMRSASDPRCDGCAATKRSAAVTNAATEVFMSAAPRPKSLPSRSVGSNGSECHFSSGPGGTTSVWPASTTSGFASPWRIQRFTTSLQRNTSALKPSGARRSRMISWQPSSSGVMERRAMSAFASARVSSFMDGILADGGSARLRPGRAARDRGSHVLLDACAQLRARAEEERDFSADEERPHEELLQVVEERRLHSLELVAEELQRPAAGEKRGGENERRAGAKPRLDLACGGAQHEEGDRHRDAERAI